MYKTFVRLALAAALSAPLAVFLPSIALADTVSVNFEPATYSVGNINGQDGWLKTGGFDVAVTATGIPSGFGTQSLRTSDSVTSGSFGDQTISKPVINAAGETDSTDGTFSRGTLQSHFEASFDLASVLPTLQAGMHVSVSPDRGDGSRMSYLRFEDQADGIHVFFDDVTDAGPIGTTASFNETDIATIDRTPHNIKFVMDFVDGPHNDSVKIYIDGVLKATGTSWEDYYRYDPEANAEQSPRIVKTLLFRESGPSTPADAGNGFLIDNVLLNSGPIAVHIFKYIGGVQATTANTGSATFPMETTFSSSNLGSVANAPFTLSPTGWGPTDSAYEASFVGSNPGANYEADEVTGGAVVGASCADGKPFALVGYTTGNTLGVAQAAEPSATVPSFTNLQSDQFVIVWNKICVPTPVHVSPANGSTLTTAALTQIDWTDVTDPALPITYRYESSNSSATNPDGSFVTPLYTSGVLSVSEIPTPGTPPGVYYWHVRAVDNDGNTSPWSTPWQITVIANPPPAPPANACSTLVVPTGYTLRQGTGGNDTVTLAPFTMFLGKGGNDTITAPAGNYVVCTGGGNDIISLGAGDSTIDGGGGNNTITTGNGNGYITTGGGNDTITTGNGAHTINGGGGNNTITTGNGNQTVTTAGGNDKVTTGSGADTINAGGGNNTVKSGAGNDTITTAGGNDIIDGGADTDTCNAGGGVNSKTNCEL